MHNWRSEKFSPNPIKFFCRFISMFCGTSKLNGFGFTVPMLLFKIEKMTGLNKFRYGGVRMTILFFLPLNFSQMNEESLGFVFSSNIPFSYFIT